MFSPIHQLVNIALWPATASSFLEFYVKRPFGTFRPRLTEVVKLSGPAGVSFGKTFLFAALHWHRSCTSLINSASPQ